MTSTRRWEEKKCYGTLGILEMVEDDFWIFFRTRGRPHPKTANLFFPKIHRLLLYCFHPETYFVDNL